MSGFRYPVQAYRRQSGHYDQGQWVEGSLTPETIQATVQPASQGDYDRMQATLSGRWVESMCRVYSDINLEPAGFDMDGAPTNGDEIDWQGQRYMVVGNSAWQSGVINHFRMLAARKPA